MTEMSLLSSNFDYSTPDSNTASDGEFISLKSTNFPVVN